MDEKMKPEGMPSVYQERLNNNEYPWPIAKDGRYLLQRIYRMKAENRKLRQKEMMSDDSVNALTDAVQRLIDESDELTKKCGEFEAQVVQAYEAGKEEFTAPPQDVKRYTAEHQVDDTFFMHEPSWGHHDQWVILVEDHQKALAAEHTARVEAEQKCDDATRAMLNEVEIEGKAAARITELELKLYKLQNK